MQSPLEGKSQIRPQKDIFRFVVDANILFSALIKNSFTAELIFNDRLDLYSPAFVVEEYMKYERIITKKTSRTKSEFIQIMHSLKDIIKVVPKGRYEMLLKEAELVAPDKNDAIYFALALWLKCGIWSNDKRLKKQNIVMVHSTDEIKKLVDTGQS
jgi:predicted nucleic acid-binding protein